MAQASIRRLGLSFLFFFNISFYFWPHQLLVIARGIFRCDAPEHIGIDTQDLTNWQGPREMVLTCWLLLWLLEAWRK